MEEIAISHTHPHECTTTEDLGSDYVNGLSIDRHLRRDKHAVSTSTSTSELDQQNHECQNLGTSTKGLSGFDNAIKRDNAITETDSPSLDEGVMGGRATEVASRPAPSTPSRSPKVSLRLSSGANRGLMSPRSVRVNH